jgi:non-ribosomal peptide synthetase component E (peptide arylation enzyme)
MRDWLPEDHLVWLGLEIVEQLDRSALHSRHPNSGPGRAAYDPDKKDGELPCAVIVAETEPPIILDELCKYLSDEGMTEWYLPTRLEYVERLPRNSNGKVRKELLRRWLVVGEVSLTDG